MFCLTGKTAFQYLNNMPNTIKFDYQVLENGSFRIEEYFNTSRNSTFIVRYVLGNMNYKYFLKQPKNDDNNFITSITNESRFFDYIEKYEIVLSELTPRIYFDKENKILLFNSDQNYNAIKFEEFKNLLVDKQNLFGKSMAQILANLHKSLKGQEKTSFLSIYKPFLLSPESRGLMIEKLKKESNLQLQNLASRLEDIKTQSVLDSIEWNATDSIIHRDVKYENLLLNKTDSEINLKLIDWEMAAVGDSHYDLADFCYYLFRCCKTVGKYELGIVPASLFSIIKSIIIKYHEIRYDSAKPNNDFFKKIYQLCQVRIIENYIINVLSGNYSGGYANIEYEKRVIGFWGFIDPDNVLKNDYYLNFKIGL